MFFISVKIWEMWSLLVYPTYILLAPDVWNNIVRSCIPVLLPVFRLLQEFASFFALIILSYTSLRWWIAKFCCSINNVHLNLGSKYKHDINATFSLNNCCCRVSKFLTNLRAKPQSANKIKTVMLFSIDKYLISFKVVYILDSYWRQVHHMEKKVT